MPSQGVRTVISLLLMMHLSVLAVIFGGLYNASELQARLMEVFRPYTQTLALDLNNANDFSPLVIIDHPLDRPIYADHQIELELAEAPNGETIVLPSGGFHGGLAYRRKLTLARYLAGINEAEDASSWLASTILEHYQAQAGDSLRCVRHYPLDPETAQSIEADQADPFADRNYETVLEVTVSHVDPNGTRKILRSQEIGSVAPVDLPPEAENE